LFEILVFISPKMDQKEERPNIEPLHLPLPKLEKYGRIAIFKDMDGLKVLLGVLKKKLGLEDNFEICTEEFEGDELKYFEVEGIGRIYTIFVFNDAAGRHKAKQVFDITRKEENHSSIVYVHRHAAGLFKASVIGRFPAIFFRSHEEFVAYFSSEITFAPPGKESERDMREIQYLLLQQQKFFAEGGVLSKEEMDKKKKKQKPKENPRSRSRSRSRHHHSRSYRDRSRSRSPSHDRRRRSPPRHRSRSRSRERDNRRREKPQSEAQQPRKQNGGGYGKHRPSKPASQKDQ
jgi:hypothetical protein